MSDNQSLCNGCEQEKIDIKKVHIRGPGVNKWYFEPMQLCPECRKKHRGYFTYGNGIPSGYKGSGKYDPQFTERQNER